MRLNLDVSRIYYKNITSPTDLTINRGGTSSTKTYSLAQVMLTHLITEPDKKILICRKYTPSLRLTVMADAKEILKASGVWDRGIFHKTEKTFLFPPTGSVIHFQGIDDEQKLKGVNFNYVWMNEGDEFSYEEFNQLYLRLRRKSKDNKPNKLYIDFNPSDAYTWIRTKLEDKGRGTVIHSTYKDNPFLDAGTLRKIKELEATDASFWKIYGLGEYTSIKGLVYENYKIVDSFPQEYKWLSYGLDFGYTNDPTALVKVALSAGELWIEESIYSTGLTNQDLAKEMREAGVDSTTDIWADSAEPKSIEELYRERFNIRATKKGRDSIMWGIQLLRRYKINIVKTSTNIVREIRGYKWAEDKNGNSLNKPVDKFNHALDALRYCCMMKIGDRGGGIKIMRSI